MIRTSESVVDNMSILRYLSHWGSDTCKNWYILMNIYGFLLKIYAVIVTSIPVFCFSIVQTSMWEKLRNWEGSSKHRAERWYWFRPLEICYPERINLFFIRIEWVAHGHSNRWTGNSLWPLSRKNMDWLYQSEIILAWENEHDMYTDSWWLTLFLNYSRRMYL